MILFECDTRDTRDTIKKRLIYLLILCSRPAALADCCVLVCQNVSQHTT
jgi:hypothetical protein